MIDDNIRKQVLSELGRKGGQARSERKTLANRAKAKKRWDDYRAKQKHENTSLDNQQKGNHHPAFQKMDREALSEC